MAHAIHRFAAYTLIVLGAVHTAFVRCYGELSPDAVWFAGSGLALVFLGLLNLAADSAAVARAWTLCRVANVLGVAFGAPAAIAVGELQGYFGLLLLVALAITSFVSRLPEAGAPGPMGFSRWPIAGLFALFALVTAQQLVG